MASKLLKLNDNPRLILWIVDFLVNWSQSQTVCHQAALLSYNSVSTGSPQGTVLSPILSTIYTNDCSGIDTTINFSFAFSTIQPHIIESKLLKLLDVNPRPILWIVNFPVNQSQTVCPQSCTPIFLFYFHWLSTRHCPISYSFHNLYK